MITKSKKKHLMRPYKQIGHSSGNSTSSPHGRYVRLGKEKSSYKATKKKASKNEMDTQTSTSTVIKFTTAQMASPTYSNLEATPYNREEKDQKVQGADKGLKSSSHADATPLPSSLVPTTSQLSLVTPAAVNDAENSGIAATALPDPIPADSLTTFQPQNQAAVITASGGLSTGLPASTDSYPSWLPTRSTSTLWVLISGTTTTTASAVPPGFYATTAVSSQSKHLSTLIIVLIIVGATCLFAGLLIIWKCLLNKRSKRLHPTPSAPILQDTPLFGGKERFSQRLWGGPSYNTINSSVSNKAGLGIGSAKATGDNWDTSSSDTMMRDFSSEEKFITFPPTSTVNPEFSPNSYYPATPATNIGVAVDSLPDDDDSDTRPLKTAVQKTLSRRKRQSTQSVYGGASKNRPNDTYTTRNVPTKPKSALKGASHSSGRERVQAPYTSRSTSQTSLNRKREKDDSYLYAIPTAKDDERRNRDTKALASALGLETPPAPTVSVFSAASLYPDDSLSMAHGRKSEVASPSESHIALGNLMLQDYNSAPMSSSKGGHLKPGAYHSRTNDKPPRVPSPPPLPSLAQMALQNADPDYRSPTYSIYGLY